MNRDETIQYLVTNCDCWKHQGDREVLNAMSDEKLKVLRAHAEKERQAIAVANAAVNGFNDGNGKAFRINPETGKWEQRQVAPVANAPDKKKVAAGKDDDEEDALDDGDDEDMETNSRTPPRRRRPQTIEDYIRHAPAEVQNTMRYAQQIEQREKDKLINELLVNVAESQRQAHREQLQRYPLDQLHNLLALVPKPPKQDDIDKAAGVANRQAAATVRRDPYTDDMLVPPVINWTEVKNGKDDAQLQPAAGGGHVSSPVDTSDEDWLKTAPPNIRTMVQESIAVNAREKRKLVDELMVNFQGDDEQEKRLTIRLNNKSLEELRDMAALQPRRQQQPPSYFGAAAPLPSQGSVNNAQEDILIPAVINWAEARKNTA